MRIGKLRQRITIEQSQVAQDPDTGVSVRTWWPFVLDEPASMDPISGREYFAADQRQSAVTTKAVIRWREGIDATMRVVHKGTVYAIRAVLPDETAQRHITLMLERGTTNGN